MNELISKLSQHGQPVIATRVTTPHELFERINNKWVFIKFPETRGGTELTVPLNTELTDLSHANFDAAVGTATLVGDLTLDYVRVRCTAEIDLNNLNGKGHLTVLD